MGITTTPPHQPWPCQPPVPLFAGSERLSVLSSISSMDTATPPAAEEVKQGGRKKCTSLNVGGMGSSSTAGTGQGGQRQGEDGQRQGGGGGFEPARDSPCENRVKYALCMQCQSTVWNETSKVVYAIVTDRTIGTVITTNKAINLSPAIAGIAPGSASFGRTNKDNKGRTPAQMTPIKPGKYHLFNLDSYYYYLTYCTKNKSGKNVFHQVNKKVKGKNDYRILPDDLENQVKLSKEDERILSFVINK